jgi:signal transduction histidine kinase
VEPASTRHRPALAAADVALAAAFIALMQLEIWVFDDVGTELGVSLLAALVSTVAGAALALRRSRPVVAFAANGLAVYVLIAFTAPSDFYQFTNLIALYSIAVHSRHRATWLALPISIGGVFLYFSRYPNEGEGMTMAMVVLVWVVAWLMGRLWGGVGERERLRVERDLSVELAEVRKARLELEEERTSMARELHDIIGHTLNVMLVHAGAARRALPANVGQAEEAIQIIETTGRSAMDDLDRVLGLLRTGGPPRSPLPGIDDLHELAISVSDARLAVTVDISTPTASISKPVQLTVYRIAQEALTNVIKHAAATAATVAVGRDGDDLVLDVCDNGRGIGAAGGDEGGDGGDGQGRGLSGMRQRAEMHGGTMTTSSSEQGGAALRCRIPMTA